MHGREQLVTESPSSLREGMLKQRLTAVWLSGACGCQARPADAPDDEDPRPRPGFPVRQMESPTGPGNVPGERLSSGP